MMVLFLRESYGGSPPNIESYHALLKENGVKVDAINDQGDCGLLFNFYDQDGNKIVAWGGYRGRKGEVGTKLLDHNERVEIKSGDIIQVGKRKFTKIVVVAICRIVRTTIFVHKQR